MVAPANPTPQRSTWQNALKSGISAAIIVFLVTFCPTAIGWFQSLARWASSSGHTPLPGISTLGYAALSAFLGALGGLGTGLFRWAQANWTWIPGTAPTFAPPVVAPPEPSPAPVTPPVSPAPANVVSELLAAIAARREAIKTAEAELDALRAALAIPEVAAG